MSFSFFVGIDISKKSFSSCIKNSQGEIIFEGSFPQSKKGFSSFLSSLNKYIPDPSSAIIGMESTSIYYLNLFNFLSQNGFNCLVINPSLINKFSKLNLRPSINDKKSAKIIADYLIFSSPEPNHSHEIISEIRNLARERENIAKRISYLKDSIKRYLSALFPELEDHVNPFTKGMLYFLLSFPSAKSIVRADENVVISAFNLAFEGKGKKPSFSPYFIIELAKNSIGIYSPSYELILKSKIKQLLELEEEIDNFNKLISSSIKKAGDMGIDIISSIPGIGRLLSYLFISEIGDIRRFKNAKKLIAYIGIDPIIKESGKYKGEFGISKRGNRHLRRIVFLMAFNVIKHENRFRDFFERLIKKGKTFKEAIIAVANKLVRTIYSMLIHVTFYSLNNS